MSSYPHLFSPLQIGSITVRNRIMQTAHVKLFAYNGVDSSRNVAYQAARGPAWLDKSHPSAAAASAVAAAAGKHGIVLSDDLHADWLVWQEPALAGHVAYDVRFELFNAHELKQLDRLERASHPAWARCGAIASVVTFPDRRISQLVRAEGVLAPGSRTIVDTKDFVAVAQPAAPISRCRRL